MAIDGVKIIDSDDGYDIYLTITERYKDGENVETILQDVLAQAENFCTDELYSEIYWTALAYSLWKIGFLNDEIRDKALAIIKGGASQMWNKVFEKAQKSRQKALDKLAVQLKSENPRPRLNGPKFRSKKRRILRRATFCRSKCSRDSAFASSRRWIKRPASWSIT